MLFGFAGSCACAMTATAARTCTHGWHTATKWRARPEHAQPLNDVVDIILEAEDAGGKGDVARIMPIGNANIVIGEQRLDRLAQEGCEVPRKRGHHQHARLSLLDVFLEMQERPERRGGERFLGHLDVAVADAHGAYAIGRALMRQSRAGDELAGRGEIPRPRAIPLRVKGADASSPSSAIFRAGVITSE